MRRKFLILVLVLVVVGGFIFILSPKATADKVNNGTRFTNCYDEYGNEMKCKKCEKKGEAIVHGAGYTCEIKAKDALKPCTFNEECDKSCAYKNASATAGFCRAFETNTYDDLGLCNRSKNDEKVNCLRAGLFD
ncbi:MAG: hypothetical protein UT02_C0061G0006 [Parcubacteria group bacterium GW2011_GWC2_38_7]|nr:MAG: hypothetical protein UT02_C0061G0006 [Parcubacteria group bacterium GW2011_GWC2_38_7]